MPPFSTGFLSLLDRFFRPSEFDLLKFSVRPGGPYGHVCPPPLHGAQPRGPLGVTQPAPLAHQRHGAALLRHQLPDGASCHVWTVHPQPRIRSWQPAGESPAGWLSWGEGGFGGGTSEGLLWPVPFRRLWGRGSCLAPHPTFAPGCMCHLSPLHLHALVVVVGGGTHFRSSWCRFSEEYIKY